MGVRDRLGRSLFVACAVGLAWGIRGDYGHVIGAMYPGAILGLAWVFVAGSPALLPRMPVIAALTAAGIGAGGQMSYGILHGYAQADTLPNYSYGLATLFLQGGCWGTFGCALAGLLAERRPMRTGDWIGLLTSVFIGGGVGVTVLGGLIGFHINPPRNDIAVAFLGAALGQFTWLVGSGRAVGLRGAVYGFIGFGLGMAGGRLLANATVSLDAWGYTVNHWNVMELTCGFVGGGVFTYGMLGAGRLDPAGEPNEFRTPAVLGALFVLGVIPLWHRLTRVSDKVPGWVTTLRDLGYPDPDGLSATILRGTDAVCAVAGIGALMWALILVRGWRWPAWFPTIVLSAVMLVFQNLTALYFWRPARSGYLNTQTGFWVLFAFVLAYPVFVRPRPLPDAAPERPFRWGRLALGTIAVLAVFVALAAVTNGDRTMRTANTRWPLWSWNEGPFPGRAKGQ
ncbi:Uncharacterized protein OS=Runella slithyformis (strain ATCC 29530 / DSM 19594 / LMG 11500 / NCIMB 11436 / LSU 4) GN=Runsl_2768 PE=4 SV=1 [Gemmata massiliana]|uniref:Uncharacterized protein n=1 Tax=Gemmata massiliana TaxID=1210884 RepID=A0A6P2DDR2_9BACT|nr:hypothetical protein [Gemmata massiliana]VTR98560.1 Uncharacterized protein OS=Runella slithyformis (strain ATCC 29530 / DSM 19594 / LMG 11500 / NCIMB 11436 / LSU 4) GN=Runsl_2768 PE=4 SV=1 [Gemmata massiliana]